MVKLQAIRHCYGGKSVLADFTLETAPGELVCLSGPSGCGKTTVLEIIAGTLRPTAGSRSVHTTHIGYAFQDDCLIPWRSAEDNLHFVLAGSSSASRAEEEAAHWLAVFGLEQAVKQKPAQLSGGMKRRLNIARAFCMEPALLLLDEPFAFQDESTAGLIAEQIAAAHQREATVIIASHEPNFAVLPQMRVVSVANG